MQSNSNSNGLETGEPSFQIIHFFDVQGLLTTFKLNFNSFHKTDCTSHHWSHVGIMSDCYWDHSLKTLKSLKTSAKLHLAAFQLATLVFHTSRNSLWCVAINSVTMLLNPEWELFSHKAQSSSVQLRSWRWNYIDIALVNHSIGLVMCSAAAESFVFNHHHPWSFRHTRGDFTYAATELGSPGTRQSESPIFLLHFPPELRNLSQHDSAS